MAIYSTKVKRPRYFDRQQLAAQDLALGQNYYIARTKQLNQHLHGWGVVCGAILDVQATGQVGLSEGFAVSPSGCSMLLPAITDLDFAPLFQKACGDEPADCKGGIDDIPTGSPTPAPSRPPLPDDLPEIMFLVARPIEQATDPRPSIPDDCTHQGNTMEYSRTCESICLEIVCELPPLHQTDIVPCEDLNALFCSRENADIGQILRQNFACPEAVTPEQDYVVLATLITRITPNERRRVVDGVRYDSRRLLLPTQTLQQYLSCLCDRPQPTSTPTVTATRTFPPTPTPTFTRFPTQTITRFPTQTITGLPTLTITRLPTGFPTLIATDIPTEFPIGVFTRPVDPLLIEGIDVLEFDPIRGENINIDQLVLLGEEQKVSLHGMGIDSVLDLYVADTSSVAAELNISEVRVAEYRDNALISMRRGNRIDLDDSEFDVDGGMRSPVEDVHNVGRVRGTRLASAGFSSVADVANVQPSILIEILSVSDNTANNMINDARSRMRRP